MMCCINKISMLLHVSFTHQSYPNPLKKKKFAFVVQILYLK